MRNSRVHVSDCFVIKKKNIVHLAAYVYMLTRNEEIII